MKTARIPKPQAQEGPAKQSDPSVQKALAEWIAARRSSKGYGSTVLRQQMMTPQQVQKLQTMGS